MKLKFQKWEDISISLYNDIKDILDDESLTDNDKEIAILALLMDETEDQLTSRTIGEIQQLIPQLDFLYKFPDTKTGNINHISINGQKYDVVTKLDKYTVSQYVDFQVLVKKGRRYYAQLLSTFVIPHGCKYNADYDIQQHIDNINNNLSIIDANRLIVFFSRKLTKSTVHTLTYLESMLLMMKKDKTVKKQIQQVISNIRQMKQKFG